jgi:hypothetical protein
LHVSSISFIVFKKKWHKLQTFLIESPKIGSVIQLIYLFIYFSFSNDLKNQNLFHAATFTVMIESWRLIRLDSS